jgi:hypothetical protein
VAGGGISGSSKLSLVRPPWMATLAPAARPASLPLTLWVLIGCGAPQSTVSAGSSATVACTTSTLAPSGGRSQTKARL